MGDMPKKVFLVGHCSPDSSYLSIAVKAIAPDCVIARVNDEASLAAALNDSPDLLMVNRMLDGDFAAISGIDLIARCRQRHPRLKAMLISNYADAQAQAVAAGAVPGFGKSELPTSKAREVLATALGHPTL